jgi:hypothetical protein
LEEEELVGLGTGAGEGTNGVAAVAKNKNRGDERRGEKRRGEVTREEVRPNYRLRQR